MLSGHDAQYVQQVAHVEADLQGAAVVINANFFFRFFLLRVIGLDLQLAIGQLKANTAVLFVGQDRGTAERFTQCLTVTR